MINLTLSRRYAKALLAIGQEDGNYELYGKEVADFADLLDSNPELYQALTNPAYPVDSRRGILEKILAKSDYSTITKNFLLLLLDKRRIGQIGSIVEVYQGLVDELSGLVRATVTSATPISEEVRGRVKSTLEKLTGKQVVMELKEDPELIGGLVARVGDLVLDGSIKTQLESLKDSLKGVG